MHDWALDRAVVAAILRIWQLGRAWATYPDGMLRSNGLISAEDVETVERWMDCIGYATTMLIDGSDDDVAFEPYDLLLADEEEP